MTAERDFDRIAAAWLLDGPTELPDRVIDAVADEIHRTRRRRAERLPWRFPTMTSPVRLVALVAILALVAIGAAALGVGGFGPAPSVAPSAPPASPALGIPVLDREFTSDRMGYSMKIPSGATVTPATASWSATTKAPGWGDPEADQIVSGDIRLIATQQRFLEGQTPEQWLSSYCLENGGTDCANALDTWEKIRVSGWPAYVDANGVPAAVGTVAKGGRLYEALVATATRAWVFTMDGDLDRAVFDAFLKTVSLYPGQAVDTPPLTSTFTSPTYGYAVRTLPEWTSQPAARPWTSAGNEGQVLDGVDITGTDTAFTAASQALGDRTFDEFLAAFHAQIATGVPNGCDGGEPTTWPEIPIGDQTGRLEMLCNAAEALVEVGGRVYLFEWSSSTFDAAQHFSFQAWKELLKTVSFTPESAK